MGAAARLRHRVGRRGTALLTFAALDVGYALRLVTADPRPATIYGWLDGPLPGSLWALAWLAVASVCLMGAFKGRDRVAFTAAIAIKVLWCCLYLSGWLLGEVTDGWVLAMFFGAFAVIVWDIAGWPEPVNGEGRPVWTPPLD